ncbi:PREDICTED: ancient ubiquitous protein 1-like [Cyphomyrmex costatus]|uniref:Lipid droplet-regulating VLDL assembly factor AUP1 n=1 Tax=Cyphomyrmex costatus TaxID=456900 RepID=A0A195CVE3_9HYME|nr:PREDICTED: ancient ubiquitous protein 1-like [Cyphomyrmex costatus]KYN04605.1 Ancient ubiquitous protein 1 [Cyphomyrmex costatus]
MSQIDIQDLFNKSRFPSDWRLLLVILYTPIGFVLVLLRLLVVLLSWLLASLLPDCNSLRTFLSYGIRIAFGIVIKIDTENEPRDKQSRIIIANSVSVLDHFALRRTTQTVIPSVWELPTALSNALGIQKMNMNNKETLIANIKQFLSTSTYSVSVQPEFGTTNNQVALLKFNSWPFSIETSVQPVAIKASRPELVPVQLTSLASTRLTEVFWFMFVPYTVFTLKYLKIRRNSDHEILVREVEKDIADALRLQTCSHTVSDKIEYEKRYRTRILSNARPTRNTPNSQVIHSIEIQRMVHQVSEVLPFVPHNVILRDLMKTRNVDVTIANILDGIVTYTPEPNPQAQSSVTSSSASSSSTKANILGTISFQEKKAKMIQEARERYIKKHGLTNC